MIKKLPIGIQTFSKIIEEDYLYVDKTREIRELIAEGGYMFLSRPRRFGKSLLVSTLKEIFSGNRELFQGLSIYDQIDWKSSPVVHLDFSGLDYSEPDILQQSLVRRLQRIADEYDVAVETAGLKMYFHDVIEALHNKYGKVVVLVDECDKPIIDFVESLDLARQNRDVLKSFYEVLKGRDPYLRFVFLTGVSKFSRVSVFSDLNNLMIRVNASC